MSSHLAPDLQFRVNNDSFWDSTGSFGFGTTTPDASALLDLTSTAKGFLPPRMTTAQMTTLAATAVEGLMIFDITTKQWMGYNGTSWVILG